VRITSSQRIDTFIHSLIRWRSPFRSLITQRIGPPPAELAAARTARVIAAPMFGSSVPTVSSRADTTDVIVAIGAGARRSRRAAPSAPGRASARNAAPSLGTMPSTAASECSRRSRSSQASTPGW
jgi:hypothetical protein